MKDFKKYFIINEEPAIVYQALTNEATLRLWTGEPAVMGTEPGSEFSLWDESITGKNIAFEPGKKLVQQWYFEGQEEPSIVTIILHAHKQGTSAELRHTNIPDDAYQNMVEGWNESYFGVLAEFYENDQD
jgi:uncharacterized protein YndB with AHSA1/START domain